MNNELEILSKCMNFVEDKFGIEYLNDTQFETNGKKSQIADKIRSRTPKIISLYRVAKKDFLKKSGISKTTIEFVQLISTLSINEPEEIFFDEIIEKLKSSESKDYFGIKCEVSVYQQYKSDGFKIKKIPEESVTTPDFEIKIKHETIYIECKSILSETVKHTPRLDSFLNKLLNKLNGGFVINIVLESKDADKYEPEIEKIFNLILEKKEEKIYKGKYAHLQFIKPKTTKDNNTDFVIPNFNPSNDIGEFKLELIDGKMKFTGGVNFLPFFPNEYLNPISKHLKKANSQIKKHGNGILHIQLPSMKVSELLEFISRHGHKIQDYINKHSLLAVIINIPYLSKIENKKNELIFNFNLPYFKSNSIIKRIIAEKPFWINSYKVIDTIEKDKILECEFSMYSPLNFFVLFITNTNLDVNVKFLISDNKILHESIINGLYKIMFSTIPNNLIKKDNLLKMKVGEVETIYINDRKLYLNNN